MDYFGINSADDLPKIKEVLAEQSVTQGTLINDVVSNHNENQILPETKETDAPQKKKPLKKQVQL
ncbi:MAG: hypothetical protein WKG06_26615 [Segetibacter sp.]